MITVVTAAGLITTSRAEFRVSARGDTTDVEVLREQLPQNDLSYLAKGSEQKRDSAVIPDAVILSNGAGGPLGMLFIRPGEVGRLQRGKPAAKLRALPGPDLYNDNPFARWGKKLAPREEPKQR
jgi:hypothetical protein